MGTEQRILIEKFLDGQCTDHERRQLKALLDTPAGKAMMRQLMEERDLQAGLYTLPGADEQDLDDKVQDWKARVNERIASAKKESGRPVIRRYFLPNAAIWAGLLLAGSMAIWHVRKTAPPEPAVTYIQKENLRGVPVRYVLPDSSSVHLAAGSTITYPEDYPQSGRDVTLEGAAFFDVKRDEAHPFTVHTGKVQTRVLGTSFRVSAFEYEPLEVAVATGKVGVGAGAGSEYRELATLTPGLRISYDPVTGKTQTTQVEVSSLEQWKSGELVFDGQPLELVAGELKRRYGVTVVCKDSETAGYRVSGTFSSTEESVEEVLRMLSILGKFRYKVQGDSIFYLYKTENMQQ